MTIRIFALVTDAFGGWGGIARYNRDFLTAACAYERVSRVVCLPRLGSGPPEKLPENLIFEIAAARGHAAYLRAILGHAGEARRSDLIYCGHINLAPLAVPLGAALGIPVVLQYNSF